MTEQQELFIKQFNEYKAKTFDVNALLDDKSADNHPLRNPYIKRDVVNTLHNQVEQVIDGLGIVEDQGVVDEHLQYATYIAVNQIILQLFSCKSFNNPEFALDDMITNILIDLYIFEIKSEIAVENKDVQEVQSLNSSLHELTERLDGLDTSAGSSVFANPFEFCGVDSSRRLSLRIAEAIALNHNFLHPVKPSHASDRLQAQAPQTPDRPQAQAPQTPQTPVKQKELDRSLSLQSTPVKQELDHDLDRSLSLQSTPVQQVKELQTVAFTPASSDLSHFGTPAGTPQTDHHPQNLGTPPGDWRRLVIPLDMNAHKPFTYNYLGRK